MIPKKGITIHPGRMLLEQYLQPLGITQGAFAQYIDLDISTMSAIVNGRRDLSQTLIMKLGMALGTGPEFWMNCQAMYHYTKNREALRSKRQIPKIAPLPEIVAALSQNQ